MLPRGWGAILSLSILILVLCGTSNSHGSQKTIDFIYIDSSVGDSAGGHTALRLGNTVFHYQYHDDAYFLLVKDDWDGFRYRYNDLQNRTLAIASLPVSPDVFEKIKMQFSRRYLLQKKRFDYLNQLKSVEEYLFSLSNGNGVVPIKGLGFFSIDEKDDALSFTLTSYIGKKLGALYLAHQLHGVEERIKDHNNNIQLKLMMGIDLNLYSPSPVFHNNIDEYFELSAVREAIFVLLHGRPVLDGMLHTAPADIGKLCEYELVRLQHYRDRLGLSIINLLESSRPGRGTALLVQAARYQAITHSIRKGEMVTLIPVENFISAEMRKEAATVKTYFAQLRFERLRLAQSSMAYFFSTSENEDIAFSQMETSLGRLWEIDHIDGSQSMLRNRAERFLNTDSIDHREILSSLEVSRVNTALLEKELLRVYDYNLLDKNCVTEIFKTIYSVFPTIDQAEKELGGYLEPGAYFSFIPFRSFNLIQQNFSVSLVEILPSFRKRQLNKLYEEGEGLPFIVESNTLTSKIYSAWEKDSTFLFFTDDKLLLRPVLGVINVLYAAGGSLGGIFSLPVDDGSLLKKSLRGIIFSLPELAFFNIRKGTFPVVVYE